MRYQDLRDDIRSGDVLAWTHRAPPWASWYDFKVWLVRLGTRSEYSHVGLAWVVAGRVFVIESVTPLVRIVPLSNLLPAYHITADALTDEQERRALSLVGEGKYSQIEAALASLDKNDESNAWWQCAEFVKWVKRLACRATPAAVVAHLLTLGGQLTEITK